MTNHLRNLWPVKKYSTYARKLQRETFSLMRHVPRLLLLDDVTGRGVLFRVKLLLVMFNLIWSTAAIPPRRRSLASSAVRLINWTAKPFIKFNKALFGGSGDLVLVTRAAAAILANHIIIMRLYCGSETHTHTHTPTTISPPPPFVFFIIPLT